MCNPLLLPISKLASSFQRVERDMLSLASSLLGQSLVANAGGNTAAVRRALEAFLLSAR